MKRNAAKLIAAFVLMIGAFYGGWLVSGMGFHIARRMMLCPTKVVPSIR